MSQTAPSFVVAIEHIGSPAVPDLAAKPILDIGVAVVPGTKLSTLDGWLTGHGMMLRGDANEIRPDRMYGYEITPMIRLANVHVLEHGTPEWRRYLAFRDHLRASTADRDAYAALKQQLSREHPLDRIAYIDGKTAFISAHRGE